VHAQGLAQIMQVLLCAAPTALMAAPSLAMLPTSATDFQLLAPPPLSGTSPDAAAEGAAILAQQVSILGSAVNARSALRQSLPVMPVHPNITVCERYIQRCTALGLNDIALAYIVANQLKISLMSIGDSEMRAITAAKSANVHDLNLVSDAAPTKTRSPHCSVSLQ
jgi:hypothetical protein